MTLERGFRINAEPPDAPRTLQIAARAEKPSKRVAFLVSHGMGQQVPFETLSVLGQSLLTEHARRRKKTAAQAPASGPPVPTVKRVVLIGDPAASPLSRVELDFPQHDGGHTEAHLYESYWAPLTEGQITFRETFAFLYQAGWNGIKTGVMGYWRLLLGEGASDFKGHNTFDRWMFGKFHPMRIKPGTLFFLLVLVLLAAVVAVGVAIAGVKMRDIVNTLRTTAFDWNHIHWPASATLELIGELVVLWMIAWFVRYFLVEFVGDVAIYVSSYKVSKFHDVRDRIQATTLAVAKAIYCARQTSDANSMPEYDQVVMVGHSLGSVIAYDTLNAMINYDEIERNGALDVSHRTTRLITFGSPLDKTAYLFRTQVNSGRDLREALAAIQQPLILSDRYRTPPFQWINIYSHMDIVSGRLKYYDNPERPKDEHVDNMIDPKAWVPIFAHTQYWENPLLHEVLYNSI